MNHTLSEQERAAYMAGDIRTAQLLAAADAKAEASRAAERLADALHELIEACTGVDYMEDAYADELAAARKALAEYNAAA